MMDGDDGDVLRIGWRERIALPDLGIRRMRAKIDTGARTAALHAEDAHVATRGGVRGVAFRVPLGRDRMGDAFAPLAGRRRVKNTSGVPEERLTIRTRLTLGGRTWLIDVTLADRGPMGFNLILGRTAFDGQRVLIDPHAAYLAEPPRRKRRTAGDRA